MIIVDIIRPHHSDSQIATDGKHGLSVGHVHEPWKKNR